MSEGRRYKYHLRVKNGCCPKCGRDTSDFIYCDECRLSHRQYMRDSRKRKESL